MMRHACVHADVPSSSSSFDRKTLSSYGLQVKKQTKNKTKQSKTKQNKKQTKNTGVVYERNFALRVDLGVFLTHLFKTSAFCTTRILRKQMFRSYDLFVWCCWVIYISNNVDIGLKCLDETFSKREVGSGL